MSMDTYILIKKESEKSKDSWWAGYLLQSEQQRPGEQQNYLFRAATLEGAIRAANQNLNLAEYNYIINLPN